jgi:hypothetical protein
LGFFFSFTLDALILVKGNRDNLFITRLGEFLKRCVSSPPPISAPAAELFTRSVLEIKGEKCRAIDFWTAANIGAPEFFSVCAQESLSL